MEDSSLKREANTVVCARRLRANDCRYFFAWAVEQKALSFVLFLGTLCLFHNCISPVSSFIYEIMARLLTETLPEVSDGIFCQPGH